MFRLLALVVVLAVVFTPALVVAEEKDKTHTGVVVKVGDHKLTIEGKDKKEHTCNVAKDAKITCEGKECKLEDLKAGFSVTVTIVGTKDERKATKIVATKPK